MAAEGLAVALFMQPKAVEKPVLLPTMISLQDVGHLLSLKVDCSDGIEFAERTSINLPFDRKIPLDIT